MDALDAYLRDAVDTLRLPTDARMLGIELSQLTPDTIDMHVTFDSGATSWGTFRTGLELTPEVARELEVNVRLLFIAELARRRMLQ